MECFEVIVVNLRARCGDIYLGVDAFVLDDCKDTEVLVPHVDPLVVRQHALARPQAVLHRHHVLVVELARLHEVDLHRALLLGFVGRCVFSFDEVFEPRPGHEGGRGGIVVLRTRLFAVASEVALGTSAAEARVVHDDALRYFLNVAVKKRQLHTLLAAKRRRAARFPGRLAGQAKVEQAYTT